MATVADVTVSNDTGANVRTDLNNIFSAVVSQFSNTTEPTTMYAYMWWADTTTGILKQRNSANSGWISILTLATGVPIAGSGISNVVEDTTPQLGGDLDLNSNNITGTGGIPSANLTGSVATARIDVGTGANQLVQLNGSSQLPAVDGSNLTNLSAGATVSASDPAIDTNATLGTQWANSTSGEFYVCTDATTDNNVWTNTGAGSGNIAPIGYVGSRGVVAGSRAYITNIEYVTIASDGNGTNFGDLTGAVSINNNAGSNKTRGVWGHSRTTGHSAVNTIDYITVASTGNAIDFGDATRTHIMSGGASNGVRMCSAGGYPAHNVIDYITIASIGNATDFGDLSVGRQAVCGVADETRICFAGGETSP